MELVTLASSLCLLVVCVTGQSDREAPCFDFQGDAYLRFSLGNFNNDGSVHYSFDMKTTAENGVIMYAAGRHGDDEAIFVRNGRLAYHLFNTSPTGVEGYFGAYFESDVLVNTGEWIKVHVYRNWQVFDASQRRKQNQTGIILEINGEEYKYVDHRDRDDISILPDIYIGGYRESLSETIGYYRGFINNIKEEKNARLFEYPTLNYLSRVRLDCIGNIMPN